MATADDEWFARYGGRRLSGTPDPTVAPTVAAPPGPGGPYGLDQQVHDDADHDVALRNEAIQRLLANAGMRGDGGMSDAYFANVIGGVDMGGDQLASQAYTTRGNTMRNAGETELDAVAAAYEAAWQKKLAEMMLANAPRGGGGGGGGGRGRGGGGGGSAPAAFTAPVVAPNAAGVRATLGAGLQPGMSGAPAYPTARTPAVAPKGAYQSAAQQGVKQTSPDYGWGYKPKAPAKPKTPLKGAY